MLKNVHEAVCPDRTQVTRNPLHIAVRSALRPRMKLIAAGLALGIAGTAVAGPFPAEFELSSLLTANGGDGGTGFVPSSIS